MMEMSRGKMWKEEDYYYDGAYIHQGVESMAAAILYNISGRISNNIERKTKLTTRKEN